MSRISPSVAKDASASRIALLIAGTLSPSRSGDEVDIDRMRSARRSTGNVAAVSTLIVPRGVEHCPIADEETHVVLLEPKSTRNTGNITNERTVAQLKSI